jgi:iron complex outermembrane recepter protein
LPADKGTLMLTWTGQGVTLDVMERYYGPLRPNPNPTFIYAPSVGNLPPWFQTDINIAHDFAPDGVPATIFLNISNLLDARPDIFQVPNFTGSPGMNYPVVPYEDIIGRAFTLGVRLRLN